MNIKELTSWPKPYLEMNQKDLFEVFGVHGIALRHLRRSKV